MVLFPLVSCKKPDEVSKHNYDDIGNIPGDYIFNTTASRYRSQNDGARLLKYNVHSGEWSYVCNDPFCTHDSDKCFFYGGPAASFTYIGNNIYFVKMNETKGKYGIYAYNVSENTGSYIYYFDRSAYAKLIAYKYKLFFEEDGPMVAEVIDNTTSRGRTLRFLYDCPHDEFKRELFALGAAPLPRYIIDRRPATEEDMENFQTIYAKKEGAVTAPATGLHFSRELMKRMEIRGINFAFITLHCGLGSFDPIEVEDLTKHKMSSEQMFVPREACELVNKTKEAGRCVCCVGVSTARATETAVGTDGLLKEYEGWTNKFMFPPYEFGLSNALVANFYHPESTMMMTQCSFGGYDLVYEAYKKAVKNGYKFGCYGDALLILDD